jgi:hypothetical protein
MCTPCSLFVKTLPRVSLCCFQIEAIKNVNSLIKKTQGVMASTKKSYEAAVQARNATGEHCMALLLRAWAQCVLHISRSSTAEAAKGVSVNRSQA